MSTIESPRTGPYSSWITASDVLAQPAIIKLAGDPETEGLVTPELAEDMAYSASEILFGLSRRQFTGITPPVTVRPVARPTDIDTRFGHTNSPSGYSATGAAATAYGSGAGGVNHFGTSKPSEIDLGGYPVVQVTLVKIDGLIIPPTEWRLENFRTLVRTRPSASAVPTGRWGWPVSQLEDLPDTEPGTFSVTYRYGQAPPRSGVVAAKTLAAQLCLDAVGQNSSLPQRVTSVSRQGVSVSVTDVKDIIESGLSGIYQVDIFVMAFNPSKAKFKPLVWSPDLGRPRRLPPN